MAGIGTTYRRDVIRNVQESLLQYAEDYLIADGLGDTREEAFVNFIDEYLEYQRPFEQWGTPYNVLRTLVEGGTFGGYYSDCERSLIDWGLNPDRYSDEKNWETYVHLIARDGSSLYYKLKEAGY